MSEQTAEQNKKDLLNIHEKTTSKASKLSINRVPDDTVKQFKENARDRWANDYGMYLAYLVEIDRLRDQYDNKFSATAEKVGELQQEVAELRSIIKDDEDEKKIDTIG
jgi:hypothetical protein